MSRYKKYMVISFGDNLQEFRAMVDFASEAGEKIGTLNLPGLLICSFVSKHSKLEMITLFKSVSKISFFVMDYDEGFAYLERPELLEQLEAAYHTDLLKDAVKPTGIDSVSMEPWVMDMTLHERTLKAEVRYDIDGMTEEEREKLTDELLDRYDNLSEYEKRLLKELSK
jgi:hypothetical protein